MDDIDAELERLKERNEVLEAQIDQIKDKNDRYVSELEAKIDFVKTETEREWKSKLNVVELECRDQLNTMSAALDSMRSAFSGDSGGWVTKLTPSGKQVYENMDTGETRDEMPEVLYIANLINKAEEAEENMNELKRIRQKVQDADTTKREADIYVNKAKTEVNHLRVKDRDWKNSAKAIQESFIKTLAYIDEDFEKLNNRLEFLASKKENIEVNNRAMGLAKDCVESMQEKIAQQENQIKAQGARIQKLIVELEDKTAKVERLSEGIESEVERMVRPMREKISEFQLLAMKEKAARAQERRELADLWPTNVLMPTVLMKHRPLSEVERQRRLDRTKKIEANRALALEIQANVAESKLWEMSHDDYGRPFYKHSKTSETLWEKPEIMDYKPPPGRDELGNFVASEDMAGVQVRIYFICPKFYLYILMVYCLVQWNMETDKRGEVFYKRSDTGEISYDVPESYLRITPSKEPEMIVGEAAQLVLGFIKEKIKLHETNIRREKEREEEIIAAEKLKLPPPEPFYPEEDKFSLFKDLSIFVYDLETVEMLAGIYNDANNKGKKKKDKDGESEEDARPTGLRKPKDLTIGSMGGFEQGPSIADVDITQQDDEAVRAVIKRHALNEEQLQRLLTETRGNLKDFSYVLLDRIAERRKEELTALKERMAREEEQMILMAEKAAKMKKIEDARLAEEKALQEAAEARSSRPGSRSRPSSAGTDILSVCQVSVDFPNICVHSCVMNREADVCW